MENNKNMTTLILMFLCYFIAALSCIWAIVSYINFLVKDDYFNWWSICSIVFFSITGFILSIKIAWRIQKQKFQKIK